MNKIKFFVFFLLSLLSFPKFSFAQDTAHTVMQENFKREIVINNKRFRVYNNWTSIGVGPAYHSSNPRTQLVLGFNFNFHIHQHYFRLGGMISGDLQDRFSVKNNYQAHAAWIPLRKDNEKYHLALMGGISYATGYKYLYGGLYDNIHPYHVWGGYAEAQLIKKIYYDVGVGGAFFVNVNSANTMIGIRLDFYLSGAYKGYVRGKEPLPKGNY
jgi:hypothetical protein